MSKELKKIEGDRAYRYVKELICDDLQGHVSSEGVKSAMGQKSWKCGNTQLCHCPRRIQGSGR